MKDITLLQALQNYGTGVIHARDEFTNVVIEHIKDALPVSLGTAMYLVPLEAIAITKNSFDMACRELVRDDTPNRENILRNVCLPSADDWEEGLSIKSYVWWTLTGFVAPIDIPTVQQIIASDGVLRGLTKSTSPTVMDYVDDFLAAVIALKHGSDLERYDKKDGGIGFRVVT